MTVVVFRALSRALEVICGVCVVQGGLLLSKKKKLCLRRAFCMSDVALVLAGFGAMIWTAKACNDLDSKS